MDEPRFENEDQFMAWIEGEKYPQHFEHVRRLLSVAEDAMQKGGKAPSDEAYPQAIALILAKAYKSCLSAFRLGRAGLTEDMGIVVRSLLNLYIIALWISKDEREERARRYLAWFWVEMYGLLSLIPAPPDVQQSIGEEYQKRKALFEYKDRKGKYRMPKHWHNSNIELMATDVGLGQHYDVVYKPLSATEHSSSLCYFGMLSGSSGDAGTVIRLRDHRFVPSYLGYALQYLAAILFLWNQQFAGLDARMLDKELHVGIEFLERQKADSAAARKASAEL